MYREIYKLKYPKTVWKACRMDKKTRDSCCLVELELPEGTTVVESSKEAHVKWDAFFPNSSAFKKCRCDKAIVKKIYKIEKNIGVENNNSDDKSSVYITISKCSKSKVYGMFYNTFVYKIGSMVISELNKNNDLLCAEGIHFFNTRKEAIAFGIGLTPKEINEVYYETSN